jgi:NifU-like protein involved in Fe-S cluster formation
MSDDRMHRYSEIIIEHSQFPRHHGSMELAALAFAGRYPSRIKCATLPWHVLKHALAKDKSNASTE